MTSAVNTIVAISHNLFLDRDDRYRLAEAGSEISTIGTSVVVSFFRGSGPRSARTNEPASEIFCRYVLKHQAGATPAIAKTREGYEICLPTQTSTVLPVGGSHGLLVKRFRQTPANLRDVKDGGAGYLRFEIAESRFIDDEMIPMIHYVKVETIEQLRASIEHDEN